VFDLAKKKHTFGVFKVSVKNFRLEESSTPNAQTTINLHARIISFAKSQKNFTINTTRTQEDLY